MANVEHSNIPNANLHEPKDVSTATAGQVYVADGAGSGAWTARENVYHGVIADVSTAETVYIPILYAGTVKRVVTVLEGAITSADATVTPKDNSGSSMGTITVTQSGSAAGDVDTLAPASNNTVTDDDFITIETDGASSTARKLWFSIVVERSD